jgi:ATP-dependent RNA helicase RhlE
LLFEQLNLIEPIRRALKFEGYSQATPIQVKAIPELLKGVDLMGCAQTGTGKTAAFAIPILTGLSELPKGPKANAQSKR